MPGIFICYRREDSIAYAGRLFDHLAKHFGKDNVFMDVDNIDPGVDFVEVLERTVSSCDALVAVIGKQWLTATDEEGRRRLDNPEDLVRLEIVAALERKVRVVPALVAGAHMPRSQDLPTALAALARRNALEISDLAFHQSVGRLVETLDKIFQPAVSPAIAPAYSAPTQPPAPVGSPAPLPGPLPVAQQQPSAPVARSVQHKRPPLTALPAWRRRLLLYWPYSVGGWLCRVLFLPSAGMTIVGLIAFSNGKFRHDSDWGVWGGFIFGAWLFWVSAYWFDKRASRKLHAGS